MHDDATWEASDWRCPVCIQLYCPTPGSANEPLIICDNMHTMCRACLNQNAIRTNTCPQCRIPCSDVSSCMSNRYIISFMERFSLRCGSCSLETKLNYDQIRKHSLECPMLRMQCPFPHTVCPENICRQNLVISSLWDHCKSVHATETHSVECTRKADDSYTGIFSIPVTVNSRQNIFLSLTGDMTDTLNMCLHIYQVQDEDGKSAVCIALRRFFPEHSARMTRVLVAIEVDEIYGLVMPLSDLLSPHSVLEAADFDQMDCAIRLPLTMLRRMMETNSSLVKMTCTLQIDFECSQ